MNEHHIYDTPISNKQHLEDRSTGDVDYPTNTDAVTGNHPTDTEVNGHNSTSLPIPKQ